MTNLSEPASEADNITSDLKSCLSLTVGKKTDSNVTLIAQKTNDSDDSLHLDDHPSLDVLHGPKSGQCFPLHTRRMFLGRSKSVDIHISTPSVSRKQIEFIINKDGVFLKNLSTVTPVHVNSRIIHATQIYNGDEISFAESILSFQSSRSQDCWLADSDEVDTQIYEAGPHGSAQETMNLLHKMSDNRVEPPKNSIRSSLFGTKSMATIFVALALIFAYQQIFVPWQVKSSLNDVAFMVESGNYTKSTRILNDVLAGDLNDQNRIQAEQLLAEATLNQGRKLKKAGDLTEAVTLLSDYLHRSDVGDDNEAAYALLDSIYLRLGERYKAKQNLQDALSALIAVRPESTLYNNAQQAISSIVSSSKDSSTLSGDSNQITDMLQIADRHFRAKRYLLPKNSNAYILYKKVLDVDPGNTIALARIESMKAFYQRVGDLYAKQKNYKKAFVYYKRYLTLEPNNTDMKKKLTATRRYSVWSKRLAEIRPSSIKSSPSSKYENKKPLVIASNANDKKRKKVEKILKASDVKSAWITDYLYEGSTSQDSPWH
ncbi:MAG: FHA domain-containing protein [Magnetococcales bacterium]|nr:FHA domain-containing protein [Magnetococcales bacterium]